MRSRFFLICAIMAVVAATHLHFIDGRYSIGSGGKTLEGPGISLGDASSYLDGALSLQHLDIVEKFNGRAPHDIEQKRPIVEGDMPAYAKYALALYPHSSFKFGYSLAAAAITMPLPNWIFEHYVPRLAFANLVLSLGLVLFAFLSIERLSGSRWSAVLAASFVGFDFTLINSGYAYQSHTTAGLFFLLAGFYLFTAERVSPARFFAIAALFSFAALSSSHVYVLGGALGLGMYLWVARDGWLRYGFAGFAGVLLWPAYIFGVEWWFGFKSLGLPTWIEQQVLYVSLVNAGINIWPLSMRFLWDPQIFNFLIYPLLAMLFAGAAVATLRRAWHPIRLGEAKVLLLLAALLITFAAIALTSQPTARSSAPMTVVVGMLLGYAFGKLTGPLPRVGRLASTAAVTCLVINYFVLGALAKRSFTPDDFVTLDARPVGPVVVIEESAALNEMAVEYMRTATREVLGASAYHYTNKSIAQFVAMVPAGTKWAYFDPLWLVHVYASTRRFWPEMTPREENRVTPEIYARDFRLIEEIFAAKLPAGAVVKVRKAVWNFAYFDQEHVYPMAYRGMLHHYLHGLAMDKIDLKSAYYFDVDALRAVAQISMRR